MNRDQYLQLRKAVSLRSVSFGDRTVTLFNEKELPKAQIGYSVGLNREPLSGSNEGDWRESWFVIADESQCGDPIFVDLAVHTLPVYTAQHGEGNWEPELIADSFQSFIEGLKLVKSIAREPSLSQVDFDDTLKCIHNSNLKACTIFWELWLAE